MIAVLQGMEDGQIEEILDQIACENEEAVVLDGLNDAIVGIAEWFGQPAPVLAYSTAKILKIFQERDGMDYEEASEFFSFNVAGLGVEHAPVFIRD